MKENISEILITTQQIQQRVQELGKQIEEDYKGKQPYMVCILKGSLIFFSDLVRTINLPIIVDTMSVSSYGASTISSGNVRINKDLADDIAGKDVIVVEDIIDSGHTLSALCKLLSERKPASLKVVSFLNKPSRRLVSFEGDYIGYNIDDKFVIGYGLDYAEKYRNLPYVGVLELKSH